MLKKVRFVAKNRNDFFPELRKRVDYFFESKGISKNANAEMVFKTVFLLTSYYGIYFALISDTLPHWAMLILAGLLGFFAASIGFCVGHDAIHGSYSANSKTNKFLAMFFNLLGANDRMWNIMHNIVHHTHTNIQEHDGDLEAGIIVRLSPGQEYRSFHKYQHIYAFFLYGLSSLSWVFVKDYKKFFSKEVGSYKMPKAKTEEIVQLFGYKIVYYVLMLVVPQLMIDSLAWYEIFAGFLVMHLVEGLTLTLVFQLAHLVEGLEFPELDETSTVPNAWAIHQMHTTANFSRDSKFANFFLGGLNFQVEHHLFPNICHVHYSALSKIVEETAHEFGVPYYDNGSFAQALKSHYRLLKVFGSQEVPDYHPAETAHLAEATIQ